MPLDATTVAKAATLYDRPAAVLLAVFAPNTALEVHDVRAL
jgi:hypothetical protein